MLDIFITCFFVYCGDLPGNNIRNLTDIVYTVLLSMELFFLAPLLSFCRPFNSGYILRFKFSLAAVKVECQLRANPGNGILIDYRFNKRFYHHFCRKTDNVCQFFRYPKQPVVQINLF